MNLQQRRQVFRALRHALDEPHRIITEASRFTGELARARAITLVEIALDLDIAATTPAEGIVTVGDLLAAAERALAERRHDRGD